MTIVMGLGLWLVYLALTANLEPSNLVLGAIVVIVLTSLGWPAPPQVVWRRLPRALVAAVRYLWIVMRNVIGGGLVVARILLDPRLPIKSGIIAIPTGFASEFGVALGAHATTLAPGELVVEIDEHGVMYTHVLDATQSDVDVADARRLQHQLLNQILAVFER
jgi:multicomponent Na+:H+ antiporter subunit E